MRILFLLFLFPLTATAQRVGIGTTEPLARLAVDSSIMIDQAGNNSGTLATGALIFGPEYKVGIGSRRYLSSTTRMGMDFYTNGARRMLIDSIGNIGIGTIAPLHKLHVIGELFGTYVFTNHLSIGNTNPIYDFENNSGYNYMSYGLGIGTVPTSTYKLDVDNGPVRLRQDVRIDGVLNPNNALTIGNNTTIEGSLLVETNKGIVRNNTSTQLKIVRTSVELSATLGAGASVDSGTFTFETFGAVPQVYVGNVLSSSNNEWDRVQYIPFDVTTNSCKFRVINHSASTVSTTARYSIMIIGQE